MARNRQRAKQRQAERRAARLAGGESRAPGSPEPGVAGDDRSPGASAPETGRDAPPNGVTDPATTRAPGEGSDGGTPAPPGLESEAAADLAVNAPPEDVGRSDTVVDSPPPPLLADPEADPEAAASRGAPAEPEDETHGAEGRNRVFAFLVASWAELQRVQWPDRKQTTTLTGVVLGFVIIMGAYLGALDALFAELIRLII